jgi:hypothetical protein
MNCAIFPYSVLKVVFDSPTHVCPGLGSADGCVVIVAFPEYHRSINWLYTSTSPYAGFIGISLLS